MFFSKKNWSVIPDYAKDFIQSLLTEDEFKQLTEMCYKYNVFTQMKKIFKDSLGSPKCPLEMKLNNLLFFLQTLEMLFAVII